MVDPPHPSAGRRALFWFLTLALSMFFVQSFQLVRHLSLDGGGPPSPSRLLAALLALVIWTAMLTLHLFAGLVRYRRERRGAPTATPAD